MYMSSFRGLVKVILLTTVLLTVALLSITVSLTAFGKGWNCPVFVLVIPNDFNVTISFNEAILIEVVSKQCVCIAVRLFH